jgi:hypothetical protein
MAYRQDPWDAEIGTGCIINRGAYTGAGPGDAIVPSSIFAATADDVAAVIRAVNVGVAAGS